MKNNLIRRKPHYGQKIVYLTFDDGPSSHLKAILNILNFYNIKAHFFFCGIYMDDSKSNDIAQLLADGHIIGNHSYTHPHFSSLSYIEQCNEINLQNNNIHNYTHHKTKFFRPPFGCFNDNTLRVVNNLNMEIILWSIDSRDWELEHEPEKIINNVLNNLHDGAIILLHETEQTLSILQPLIESILKKRYSFALLNY
ncbi:polysaccharide deacetylase family protein [Alkalithermobacter paradoxus]|uniref:Peptidoglycan-N-acetylglucosamine deacetylase n=1 Tax=Alkalithermobacter paradoxus TaxID=29349 RepID=A0A1V4I9F3_9FIRM|nr:peptidoglycan-N-acetylglucosamine deacetylase [[Clostridium] thermoalcaliphilum]